MQFLVFAAFAMVLSAPDNGPPWWHIRSEPVTLALMWGQILVVGVVCSIFARQTTRRLERDPAWLPGAQARFAAGRNAHRLLMLVWLLGGLYATAWVRVVRSWPPIERYWGLDELIILAPFLLSIVVGWIALYPADRAVRQVALELRLWSAAPVRPVWSLAHYLLFNLRQDVLIILLPLIPISIARDFSEVYSRQIRRMTGIPWADQAVLVIVSGIVFLFAPLILRYVWHTRMLPPGDLRTRLENLCRRTGLTYRNILVWESDGMVVNAAVMGLFKPVRYILLSDGLLELIDDDQIEAVFGHEAGHVRRRHIEFYLFFAVLSMLVVGGIFELVQLAAHRWPQYFPHGQAFQDYLQMGAMTLILVIWGIGFGYVSRLFECQADLYGCRSITPGMEKCSQPCLFHGTAAAAIPETKDALAAGSAVCATAAIVFSQALERIAALNGIPLESRGWRHPSIGRRMRLLQQYTQDPASSRQTERVVRRVKVFLFIGSVIGCAIALWLYWPWKR